MNNLPLARSGRSALEVATEAAREAGKILLAHFHSEKEVKHKSKSNLVTEVDVLSEKLIVELLQRDYPDYNILSEESNSTTPVAGYTWIVDPLDGTNNYVFGIPFFCVSIALVKDDDILLGVTYDPLRGELFRAEKGRGAYLNDSAIHVSKESSLQDSLVGLDLGYSYEQGSELLDITSKLWGQVHCLRIMGSASLGLAYVACGRVNLYFHRFVYPWDIAGGLLLIREAGGKITDWQGKRAACQSKQLIASNDRLHREFMACLKSWQAY
ncbi:MAG: inositol monophosphatase [Dehalococcoidia bacterium]|nr:inositol monophosphatase [Dehalococcoidia bacterium]